jgi:AcrR family transcriptional regulator
MSKTNETRLKILESANKLFANYGFDGTSIRDIAKEAGVNLAAVNYHFKNKNNLYCEIFDLNCCEFEKNFMSILDSEEMSTEDFAVTAFKHFLDNGHSLLNTFKIILNDNVQIPDEHLEDKDGNFGPPGGGILLSIITKEVGEEISLDARFWAMNMIFTHITHMSIILSSSIVREKACALKHFSDEIKERNIRYHCRSILEFIKNSPADHWDSTLFSEYKL